MLQGRCLPQAASVLQVFAALLKYREFCVGELRQEREIFYIFFDLIWVSKLCREAVCDMCAHLRAPHLPSLKGLCGL